MLSRSCRGRSVWVCACAVVLLAPAGIRAQLNNVALGKTASQSSTAWGGDASRAVDGNTSGEWGNNSVSHTGNDAYAWWQVDLGSSYTIGSIAIWNRTESMNRLSDYWVFVSDTPFGANDTPATLQSRAGTWANHQTSYPNPATPIVVNAQGRYVRVQLSGTNYLHMAEVQVMEGGAPSILAVAPSSGSGRQQTFSYQYYDPAGYMNLTSAEVDLSQGLAAAGACYVWVWLNPGGAGTLHLASDAGVWQAGMTIGLSGTTENSQCIVDAGASSTMGSGNTMVFNIAVTFKAAYAGEKVLWGSLNNANNLWTGWVQRGTWTATATGSAPSVSVSPSTGSGYQQTFSFQYYDEAGYANLKSAEADISEGLTAAGACYVWVWLNPGGAGTLYLNNDAGNSWQDGKTIGASGTTENSQCRIDAGASSTAIVGSNTLRLNVAVTFKPAYAGNKILWANVENNSGLYSTWVQRGTWTVVPAVAVSAPAFTPAPGTYPVAQTVTMTTATTGAAIRYTTDGSTPSSTAGILYTGAAVGVSATTTLKAIAYKAGMTDSGVVTGTYAITGTVATPAISPAAGTYASAQTVTISCGTAGASIRYTTDGSTPTGTTGTVYSGPFLVTASATVKAIGYKEGWTDSAVASAAYTIPEVAAPSAISVSPVGGTGLARAFTFHFSDGNGASDIREAQVVFGTGWANSKCWIYYHQESNGLWLADDNDTWMSPVIVGQAGTTSNSRCTLDAGASSVSKSGTDLYLTLAIAFQPGFAGSKSVQMAVQDMSGLYPELTPLGTYTWTVGPSTPQVDSVYYASASGWSQLFAFTWNDADGGGYINVAEMQFSGAPISSANACYVWYDRANNRLSLRNDADTDWSSVGIGSAGMVENSQCTLDGSSSTAVVTGTQLKVQAMIVFKPAFSGVKYISMRATAGSVNSGPFQNMGTWTVIPRPDFNLTITPASETAAPGTSATYTVSAQPLYNFDGNVNLAVTASNLPPGATMGPLSKSALSITPSAGDSATFTVSAGSSGASDGATLTATGTSGTLTHAASARLWVGVGGAPSAESVSPHQGTGAAGTFVVTVSHPSGPPIYTRLRISEELTGKPACEVFYWAQPNRLYLLSDQQEWTMVEMPGWNGSESNSQCRLFAQPSWKANTNDTMVVAFRLAFLPGFAGPKKLFASAYYGELDSGWAQRGTWTVTADQDFDLSISPAQLTRSPGMPAEFTVTVTPLNGFSNQVQFALPDLPPNLWVRMFNPLTVAPSGNNPVSSQLTLFVPTSARGYVPVRVVGQGTDKTAQAELLVQCDSPTISVLPSPTEQSAPAGASRAYILTVKGCGGFSGGVNVAPVSAPAGVQVVPTPANLFVPITPDGASLNVNVATESDAAPGRVVVTLRTSGQGATNETDVVLNVLPPDGSEVTVLPSREYIRMNGRIIAIENR